MNIGVDTEKVRKILKEHLKRQREPYVSCINIKNLTGRDDGMIEIGYFGYQKLLSDSILKDYYYKILMEAIARGEDDG